MPFLVALFCRFSESFVSRYYQTRQYRFSQYFLPTQNNLCQSDYFRGHHLPVIQVPVFGNMTAKMVLDEIMSELNQCFELYDHYTDEMIEQAVANWRKDYDQRKTFVKISVEDRRALKGDFCEPAYLFFVCGELIRPGTIFNEIVLPE